MHKTWAAKSGSKVVALAAAALAASLAGPAWGVNKCTGKDGAVVYQDAPCDSRSADAQRLVIQLPPVAPPRARAVGPVASAPQAAAPSAPAPAPMPQVVAPPARSDLEARADVCLNWYRPLLRDPRSAYWRDAHYVQATLNITVVASNAYGGFVDKEAACDFRQGSIDEGWTKTQAKRRGWAL